MWSQKVRYKRWGFLIALSVLLLFGGAFIAHKAGILVFGEDTKPLNIPESVTIAGKTYTAENPFVVLEIVPQEGLAEWGYMVGGDSMPIPGEDIKKIEDHIDNENEKNNLLDSWSNLTGPYTQKWGRDYYPNYSASIIGYSDRNLLANGIFKSSAMSDKMKVKAMGAEDVTKEDVENADMVYVNTGHHADIIEKNYNFIAEASKGVEGLTKEYRKLDNNSTYLKHNISAEVALTIYIRSVKEGMPLIFDNSDTALHDHQVQPNDNYSKLGNLVLDIDPDIFVADYALEKLPDGTYQGEKGTIGVYRRGKEEVLEAKRGDEVLVWDAMMFTENNISKYPYPNGGADGRNKLYLRKNIFSYDGDNSLTSLFLTGGDSSKNDYDKNQQYLGTDFEIAKSRYGTTNDGKLLYTDMIRYIIGDIPRQEEFHITALEIQPSAAYRYNNFEGAKKIASYFGFDTGNMTEDNYTSYVSVRCVPSNGFNGMNEDLKENYDLILVGDNNPKGYLKYNKLYSPYGETINITGINKEARLSGNDLTQKSLNKLMDYVKAEKPIVLAKDIYYNNKEKIEETSNISHLSFENLAKEVKDTHLKDSNVLWEPDRGESFHTLIFMKKPDINVDDSLKVQYDNDIVKATVSADTLSNFQFPMHIDSSKGTYQVSLYIDKNGNGIFTQADDDSNELVYNHEVTTNEDGAYTLNLQLPDTLRGYIAWKAVVKSTATGLSSEARGGFVVKVNPEDRKTVKLLQIMPISTEKFPITLNMKENGKFQSLFQKIEEVTGMNLDVTTMTTREFERLYNNQRYEKGNYNANNPLLPYSMVVLGFSDAFSYDDISNDYGALDNLYDYMDKGNSVLFVHDLTSFIAYSDEDGTVNYGKQLGTSAAWSFQLTSKFRNRIGMDRYGVSVLGAEKSEYMQGYTNEFLLGYGKMGREAKYSPYQAISNTPKRIGSTHVDQLNTGQVTEFPYKVEKDLEVANTHAQYFQLDLEADQDPNEDVVVWYTLGTAPNQNNYYTYAGQDARNSYYIYSKGNITYTGAGHSKIDGEPELKLFVNTIVRAIMSGNSVPVVQVENAVMQADGTYDMFTRNKETLPAIEFTATDADLSKTNGIFKSGMVYWDVDGDGVYGNSDVPLISYNNSDNPLKNASRVTVDLNLYSGEKSGENTLLDAYRENTLKIGITAVDNLDAQGSASVSIYYRNLFQLN